MSEQKFACRLGFIALQSHRFPFVWLHFQHREALMDINDQTRITERQAKSMLKMWDFYSQD